MAASNPNDEQRISKPTLALAIETAVRVLSKDAVERVMIAIRRVELYRDNLRIAADRIESANDEAVGEALNRTLVGDGRDPSFHMPFVSELIKSILRSRSVAGARYTPESFRSDFPDLEAGLANDGLSVGQDGLLQGLASAEGGVSIDTAWVREFDRNVLDGLRDLLREIKQKQDVDLEAQSVVISRLWRTQYSLLPRPDRQLEMALQRMGLLKTLQQRGAIIGYQGKLGRISEGGGIRVEAERRAVAATIRAIDGVLSGREGDSAAVGPVKLSAPVTSPAVPPESSRANQPAALRPEAPQPVVRPPGPTPDEKLEFEVQKTHRVERAKLLYQILTPVAVAVILGFLALVSAPFRDWVATRWQGLSGQAAQSGAPADSTNR